MIGDDKMRIALSAPAISASTDILGKRECFEARVDLEPQKQDLLAAKLIIVCFQKSP